MPGGKFEEVTWAGSWNGVCHIKIFGFLSNCNGYLLERFQERSDKMLFVFWQRSLCSVENRSERVGVAEDSGPDTRHWM